MKSVMERLMEHYNEARTIFPEEQIVGIFLQGSQNYGLDYEGSDIDTKLILVPSFKDICLNKKPVSTTYIRENEEHIDLKDIRLYVETFRKQNLNFLEILFTDYYFINPLYEEEWNRLVANKEKIATMNKVRAVKSMYGVAMEKYHAMKHPYPSKIEILNKYGYDGKQVHHLLRVQDYLRRYIAGESYKNCLHPTPSIVEHLLEYKRQLIPLEVAEVEAEAAKLDVEAMMKNFCDGKTETEDQEMRDLLEDVSYKIMKIAVRRELL